MNRNAKKGSKLQRCKKPKMSFVNRRVLSIQSQVVHGCVGNSCAVFPMQLFGFDVCPINSVQFSNHKGYASVVHEDEPMFNLATNLTGYKTCTGKSFTSDDVQELYNGLKENGLDGFSHVLSGYVGNATFLNKVCDIIVDLKKTNPNLLYVCDPVMGDNDHMYVPQELLPIYKERVLPLADVIVPNQFEAQLLTGQKITNESDAISAMNILHKAGVKTVVISSSDLGDEATLLTLASTQGPGQEQEIYRINIPKLRGLFVGTGDLFASLLLVWLDHDRDLPSALEKTIATMQKVIRRTLQCSLECCKNGRRPTAADMELRLVQSKNDIENPHVEIKAERITPKNQIDYVKS